LEIVKELLRWGADHSIGYKNTNSTPLFMASQNGIRVCSFAVVYPPLINSFYSVGHLEIVKELIKAGADVNATRTDIHASSLTVAAEKGWAAVVKELIKHKADVDMRRSNDGTTPLIWAALKVHPFLTTVTASSNVALA